MREQSRRFERWTSMKLSTRGRYGIHAMYNLAEYAGEGPQSIKAIAERQQVPEAYLEQLIAVLRKAELVQSVRGAQGGYMLSRAANEITVGQVLRALEGELALVDCLTEGDACEKACVCPTRVVWRKLHEGVNQIVDGITLQDMLNDHERLLAQGE